MWWKKAENSVNQIMTINSLDNVTYVEAKKIFGPPHETKEFNTGVVHAASWIIEILGVKFTIRFDAGKAAREEWHDKEGKMKYQVPSVEHEIVKSGEVIGEPKVFRTVIRPLLMMIIKKKYNSLAAKHAISYLFEEE